MGETWSHEALTGKGGEIEERPEGWSEVSEEMEGLVSRAQMEGLISLGKEGSLVSLHREGEELAQLQGEASAVDFWVLLGLFSILWNLNYNHLLFILFINIFFSTGN